MSKRSAWMGFLLMAMICSVILFRRADITQFQGLQIKSGEQLGQLTENLSDVSGIWNVEESIELDGKAIPYDQFQNTFYVSQSMKNAEYSGRFHVIGDQCSVYFQEDDALKDKQTAISEGHIFRLWFVAKEDYAVADLIFTGLPVITIRSDENGLTENYGRGVIVVQDPDDRDVVTMSIKDSAVQVKTNYHSDTISFKLCKENYQEERNLNLLGLGKRTSWKLYPVHDRDGSALREMLSAYVWNCVCEDKELHRDMEYVEVIVDGEYSGLYYLAAKVGKGYLNLGEEDRLYRVEGNSEDPAAIYMVVGDEDTDINRQAMAEYESLWDEEVWDSEQINIGNYIDYHIWLQAVCGIQSDKGDYCIVAYKNNGVYKFSRMPDRSKFVFGIFPSEIGWESLTAAEMAMEDRVYEKLTEMPGMIPEIECSKKWRKLRDSSLSTERMHQYIIQCSGILNESGYIARNRNREEYKADCLELREFVDSRMNYLDSSYYNLR